MADEVGSEFVPLEADPASLRSVAEDLRIDADAFSVAASNVQFDVECVSGSAIAAVLAQIRPIISASIESASTRLLEFADNVEQSAQGYQQVDAEFAQALKQAAAYGDPRGQAS
ncbi:hypothetical protein [Rhodococcoides yunnanense]|uniref:hypothetical protein n=1 Tax=Rhodococcoides yunnanense TaxID=278209 RepID=UPI001114FBBA|nr:hypothetical protein [Rhodococcus yunnanensis]